MDEISAIAFQDKRDKVKNNSLTCHYLVQKECVLQSHGRTTYYGTVLVQEQFVLTA